MHPRFPASQVAAVLCLALVGTIAVAAPVEAFAGVIEPVVRTTPDNSGRHASAAFGGFMATYWNPATRTFFEQSDHSIGPDGRRHATIWWVAQAWDVVMDDYERTRFSSDRRLIDDVFDGWIAHHGWFNSSFNDDRGWWALGATRAYELTGESRFLGAAIKLADDQWRSWDSTFGGGLWWRRDGHDQKNVATNAPASMTNAILFRLTGRPRFKTRAIALFAWVDGKLRSGSRIDDRWELPGKRIVVDYSYNYGTYVGAALDLYAITGKASYVDKATSLADSAMSRLSTGGVLRDEGTGDGGGFKGIFIRNLRSLTMQPSNAIAASKAQTYTSFVAHNSTVAWSHRTTFRLWTGNWATFASHRAVDVLTDSSAVSLFESQALTSP